MCFAINPMIASSLVTCVCETNKMTKRTIAVPIRIRRKGKCRRMDAKNCDLKRIRRKEYSQRSRPWRRGRLFDDDRDASVQRTRGRFVAAVSLVVQGKRILFTVAF